MSQDPHQHIQFSKKIGSTMTLLSWIGFLGVLTLLFGNLLDQQENPNKEITSTNNDGVIEVILEQNRFGHYVATANFNNIPVDLIIDTGATDVSVPGNIAEKIGLKRGSPIEVITANGTISVFMTKIDTIELGKITLHNVRANINPHIQDDFVLLGMSFLENLDITQSQGKMVLRK